MDLVQHEDFMRRTLGGRPCQMDVSIYAGLTFDCACGRVHDFAPATVPVLRELPKMCLVLACPEGVAINCVRIRGIFRRHLQTLFGAEVGEDTLPSDRADQLRWLASALLKNAEDDL